MFPDLASFIPPTLLAKVLLIGNVAGAALMGLDKVLSITGFERIGERDIGLVALAGGFIGVTAVGLILHHKVSKPSFWVPVVLGWILWSVFSIVYLISWAPSWRFHLWT